ncbi:hypothetical protein RJT34_15707 [Clitoria ternatea]|uniref:Uncharacterized protein n=1 Tax=Clitoria ternatea TaxID=43366 RepID=A0AAN9J642_CLITE
MDWGRSSFAFFVLSDEEDGEGDGEFSFAFYNEDEEDWERKMTNTGGGVLGTEAISNLPDATEKDNVDEEKSLKDSATMADEGGQTPTTGKRIITERKMSDNRAHNVTST